MEILKNPNFDFLGKTKVMLALSALLLLVGWGYILTRGVRYGVEFSGGTQIIARFTQTPEVDKIRSAVDRIAPGAVIQTYDDPSSNQVLIRLPQVGQEGTGTVTAPSGAENELIGPARTVLDGLKTSYPENPVTEASTEIVGPVVGAELRQKAIQLTLLGLFFQLLYIGFRFKGAVWGAAASIAVLHDVVITIGLLALFQYEITLNVIAALLTLVGYSVNDTIVIFDRVRENLRQRRKEPLAKLLNDSLNQTLTRTVISNGTTFLTVLGLYLFGGEVLKGFGFTMVIGIVIGTYSTIWIASPIVLWWTNYSQRKGKSGGSPAMANAAV